jgi:hypothetical protein
MTTNFSKKPITCKKAKRMKKIHYFSAAIAVAALASCSSDDLQLAGANAAMLAEDGSQVLVTVNEPADALTRAGFATEIKDNGKIASSFIFQEGDVFKMYCKDTWKPQIYKFTADADVNGVNDAAIFTFADDANRLNQEKVVREYAVFPQGTLGTEDYLYFKDEYRTALQMNLPKIFDLNNAESKQYAPGATTVTTGKGVDLSGRKVFTALVPMFGYAKENTVKFNYMTGLVRVHLQGLGAKKHTLKLAPAPTASKFYQLSGEFTATGWDAAKIDEAVLPEFKTAEKDAPFDDDEFSVTFTSVDSEIDYVVFVPVPVGTYDFSQLELSLDETTVLDVCDRTGAKVGSFDVTPGVQLQAKSEGVLNASAASLKDINEIITENASWGKDVVIDVALDGNIKVPAATDDSKKDEYKYIILPELKNNVVLNISGGSLTENVVIIKDADGVASTTGKLTINFTDPYGVAKGINATTKQAIAFSGLSNGEINIENASTVELAGTLNSSVKVSSEGAVKVLTNVADLTISKATDIALDGIFTTLSLPAEITGELELNGEFNGMTIKAGSVKINAVNFTAATEIESATIVIEEGKTLDVNGATTFKGDVTVAGTEKGTKGFVVEGNVTVEDGASLRNVEITGEGKVLTIEKGAKDVNNLISNGNKVVINGQKFNKLTLKAPIAGEKAVKINGGNGQIIVDASYTDGATTEVYTSATTDITVDDANNKLTFKADWDENTAKVTLSHAATDIKIYTAAQLAGLAGSTTGADMWENITLMTDVVAATDVNWDASNLFLLNDGPAKVFDGNGKTISGLVYTNGGFFDSTKGTITIKNLTLDGVKSSETHKKATRVGGLLNANFAKATIENVVVKGTTLGNADGEALSEIGGLVGYTNASITITNSQADFETIKGTYNMGGMIGSATNGAAYKIEVTDVKRPAVKLGTFAISKAYEATGQRDANAATIGMLIGHIGTGSFTATVPEGAKSNVLINANNKAIVGQRDVLGFKQCYYVTDGETFYFQGPSSNYIGYSKGHDFDAQKVTINGVEYKEATLNKFVLDTKWAK